MKRRILSILLLAALVIGLLPQGILSVSANDDDIAYPVEGGNVYFDKMLYDMGIGSVAYCDDTIVRSPCHQQMEIIGKNTEAAILCFLKLFLRGFLPGLGLFYLSRRFPVLIISL